MDLAPLAWFYTRLGIGVFDPQWWKFRLLLFAATALPSVARFCRQGAHWAIFVDDQMDDATLTRVKGLIDQEGIGGNVHLVPIQFNFDLPARLHQLISDRHFGNENVSLIRIDDDDAVAENVLTRFADSLPSGDNPTLVSLIRGWEVALAERKMRPMFLEYGSLNTMFHGPTSMVEAYAGTGHHQLKSWAVTAGLRMVLDAGHDRSFMYVRHKQSDSSFATRRAAIMRDRGCRDVTRSTLQRFGINEDRMQAWREYARTAPGMGNRKTWDIASDINERAYFAANDRHSLKQELISATSSILQIRQQTALHTEKHL